MESTAEDGVGAVNIQYVGARAAEDGCTRGTMGETGGQISIEMGRSRWHWWWNGFSEL